MSKTVTIKTICPYLHIEKGVSLLEMRDAMSRVASAMREPNYSRISSLLTQANFFGGSLELMEMDSSKCDTVVIKISSESDMQAGSFKTISKEYEDVEVA